MADSWEASKSQKPKTGLIIIIVCVIVALGILVYNNIDFFSNDKVSNTDKTTSQEEKVTHHDSSGSEVSEQNMLSDVEDDDSIPIVEQASAKNEKKIQVVDTSGSLLSVVLPTVTCRLADAKSPSIQVSLKLYFTDPALEKEILFKRDAILVGVKKIFAPKQLDEIVVEELRGELQKATNNLLEKGTIADLEFLDFRPAEKK